MCRMSRPCIGTSLSGRSSKALGLQRSLSPPRERDDNSELFAGIWQPELMDYLFNLKIDSCFPVHAEAICLPLEV